MSVTRQKQSRKTLNIVFPCFVCVPLLTNVVIAGKYDSQIARLVGQADQNFASRPELAAAACADAIRLDSSNKAAQECLSRVRAGSVVDYTFTAAVAAQASGRINDAKTWCDAALVADPSKAGKCGDIEKAWLIHQQQTLMLEQARFQLQRKSFSEVDKLLASLQSTTFPDIVGQALVIAKQELLAGLPVNVQLGLKYLELSLPEDAQARCKAALEANPSDPTALQCLQQAATQKRAADEQKAWAAVESAKALLGQGKRDEAAKALVALVAPTPPALPPSPAVRTSALQALSQTQTSNGTAFVNALKSQWIMECLAGLAIICGLWFGLHLCRWLWRTTANTLRGRVRKIKWAYLGIQDDGKIGASDAVLDALRRVPNEVKIPVWTPGWLILHATEQGFEVWEDFGTLIQKPLHEDVFSLHLNQGRAADNALADAFQNLQFNVGTVGLNAVARVWRAIMDWWRDGQPAFSGVAQETQTSDGSAKQVVIRLMCSGGPYGTVSVMASTKRDDNVDVVALTASRAAYKLLSRLSVNSETIEQIDGHAAFRQGAKIVACHVRSSHDSQPNDTRTGELSRAIANLEFARQVFCRDTSHQLYYLETLRFEAAAYCLLGRGAAALALLEELQDRVSGNPGVAKTTGEADADAQKRSQALVLEASYNQGVLHLAAATAGAASAAGPSITAELRLARESFLLAARPSGDCPVGWAATARFSSVLAAVGLDTWPLLDQVECRSVLDKAKDLIGHLDDAASESAGTKQRAFLVLSTEARRDFAVAEMRYIATFEVRNRGPYEAPPCELRADTKARIQQCLAFFGKSDAFGSAGVSALVGRAYALLLSGGDWGPAEFYAQKGLALDKTCEIACYVAAEASLQRGDRVTAQNYIGAFAPTPVRDSKLSRLSQFLSPL